MSLPSRRNAGGVSTPTGRRSATALRYDSAHPAPFVVARGVDELADRLQVLARHYSVPVVKRADLAERLVLLEPGRCIPESLYEPVAKVLIAFLQADRIGTDE